MLLELKTLGKWDFGPRLTTIGQMPYILSSSIAKPNTQDFQRDDLN